MNEILRKYGEVLEDVNLKDYNTFQIGGKAKYLVIVNNIDSLVELMAVLKKENLKYFIIGNGSNIVFSDKYFDGVIIKLNKLDKYEIDFDKKLVYAQAGVYFPSLVPNVIAAKLKGLEWASGIPGTIGGSVVSNAGGYNSCVFDFLKSVKVIDPTGEIKILKKEEIEYAYRYTMFKDQKNYTILAAEFELMEGNPEDSKAIILDRQKRRLDSQPLEYPSAGSVFRNPNESDVSKQLQKYGLKGPFAGHLIEECGLKGKTIGGAAISEKHANFIINLGDATSQNVKDLIEFAHKRVLEKFEIDLVIEQEFVNWE